MKKKVFFSGGNGFIGKNFCDIYADRFDIKAPRRQQLELTKSSSVEAYFSEHQFDCIVQGANVGGTRKSQYPSFYCLNENLRTFAHLFQQRQSVARFIQLGSGAEYGRPLKQAKIDENEWGKEIPQDEYGFSKLLCSQWVVSEPPQKAVTLHLFGVFGPYEDYQIRFISQAIVRTLFDLPIIIHQDVKFDYLYVKDCVKIVEAFINKPPAFSRYNLGTGQPIQLTEIAELVRATLGTHNEIILKTPELGHEYTCNNDKLMDFLGKDFDFTPFGTSIKELAQWYEKNFAALNREWILNP